jgi:hypothetical protein
MQPNDSKSSLPLSHLTKGLLPLKLNTGSDRREIDRAELLIASLCHFWKGAEPFLLHVVGRDDELEEITAKMASLETDRIHILVYPESAFFPASSPFHAMKGMYKQQIIKLYVPQLLGLEGFLTLDADVICIREFDESTFVRGDRIISNWESRTFHSWWENSMSGIRAWCDLSIPGLGVTPNTLHGTLCSQIFKYLELRRVDPLAHLLELAERHPLIKRYNDEVIPLAWSEYSLYTIVGEWFDNLYDYHLSPEDAAAASVQFFSRRNVWSPQEAYRLAPDPDDPGYFLVVQSWAAIPVEEIQAKTGLHLLAGRR